MENKLICKGRMVIKGKHGRVYYGTIEDNLNSVNGDYFRWLLRHYPEYKEFIAAEAYNHCGFVPCKIMEDRVEFPQIDNDELIRDRDSVRIMMRYPEKPVTIRQRIDSKWCEC